MKFSTSNLFFQKYGEFEVNVRKVKRSASRLSSESEEDNFADKENHTKRPTDLFEEGIDVEGRAIFGFRTPGKKGAMSEYAANTPKSARKSMSNPRTPKTPRNLLNLMKTPKFMNSPANKQLDLQATPRHDRERNRRSEFSD